MQIHIVCCFLSVLAMTFFFSTAGVSAFAQAPPYDPVLDQGTVPFQSYDGGVVDSVNLATGALAVHIPLVSFPQRGKRLRLDYMVGYNTGSASIVCPGYNQPCYYQGIGWMPLNVITNAFPAFTSTTYPTGQGTFMTKGVVSEGGNGHLLGWISSTQLRATDGTGFFVSNSPNGTMIVDRNGIATSYTTNNNTIVTTDPNGNEMTYQGSGPFQVTDTLGRVIPNPPGVGTTDFSLCPSGTTQAYNWVVPGTGGTTATYKICSVLGIVLPDLKSYTFQYRSVPLPLLPNQTTQQSFNMLSTITFPSGGSISYGYGPVAVQSACTGTYYYVPVVSRTVDANDGTGPHTWTYTRQIVSGSVVTTVIDPLGNKSVHTFNAPLGVCEPYEAQDQEYDNVGNLLKTVSTVYSSIPNPGGTGSGPVALDVLPTSITTIWPNGQQATVSRTYDRDHGSSFLFGTWLDQVGVEFGATPSGYTDNPWSSTETDYGQGAPGAPIRVTNTAYQAFTSSSYFPNNLLDLISSVQVTDGAGTQKAYTTFAYDGAGLQSSGVTQSKVAGESFPGNQTSVSRWLSSGSAVAQAPCNVSVASGGYLTTSNVFYDTGDVQKSTDPCLYSTTYQYSGTYLGAYPTTVTNPANQATNYAYDFNTGRVTSTTDANFQTATRAYDIMERLTQVSYPDGGSMSYCYTDLGGATCSQGGPPFKVVMTKAITGTLNETSTRLFDGLGRLFETQLNSDSPSTAYTDIQYDGLGRKSRVYNPTRCSPPTTNCGTETTWGYTTYNYDALSRATSVVEQDGSLVSTAYVGNCTTTTDEAGKSRKSCVDGLGKVTKVVEDPSGLNFETDYQYDVLGNLICAVQKGMDTATFTTCAAAPATWRPRSFAYDSLSRLTSGTNPESGTISYTYDADGNVLTKTAPLPNVSSGTVTTTHQYDVLNRVTGKTYTGMTMPNLLFGYDGVTPTGCSPPSLTDSYPVGRRTSMCDGSGATSWSHDKMGRVLSEKQTQVISGGSNVTKTASYDYNLDGSLKTLTYPSGNVMTYAAGGAGRMTQVSDSSNNYVGYSGNYATYTPGGALAAMTHGHTGSFAGIVTTNSYNNRLQPAVFSAANPTQTIFSLSYGFNPGHDNGNVQQIVNNLDATRSMAFIYDSLNRISQANTTTTTGANCWGETYTIDAWGNLTNIAGVSGMTGCYTESQNAPVSANNQITGWCYDGAGNLLDMGSCASQFHSFVYDAEGHLQSPPAVGSGLATLTYTYYYDGEGNRVQKCNANPCTSGGTAGTLYWLGAGGEVLDESGRTGTLQEEYVYFNGQRIARRDLPSGNVHYYFSNHLGSASVITDSSGNVQQQTDYYPFGGIAYTAGLDSNRFKFTGKERDSESGLDNFGSRYYGSSMGRFMTPDPLMASAHASNPQTWNRYSYALNNPLRFVDPDGMKACDDKDKCVEVRVNVIYDQNANKGKGLTQQQKDQIQKQVLAKAQDQFGTSKIKLDLNFTAGKVSLDSEGNASFSGLQKGALNLLFTEGAPYAATQGDAGATQKAGGMYLSVVDIGNSEFDEKETVPHELAHQFLGDPDRTPNKDALIDAGFHIYREADIGVRNFFQRQGVSQTDYQQGAKKFSPAQTQENITPKQ